MTEDILKNIEHVRQRIAQAAVRAGRKPQEIALVAVTKYVPAERINTAIRAGVSILGESYIQEARSKIDEVGRDSAIWHFIGHLQTNKAKYAARLFDMIESVASVRLAQELDSEARKAKRRLAVLIQVNIGEEASKSGIPQEELIPMAKKLSCFENISVQGLMAIPPYLDLPDQIRPYFRALRALQRRVQEEAIPNIFMKELSMGMSADFETAIEEGATMVRIGTVLFGSRG
ncbi:MAG: YggS family pyridoxal phosphate-dependent enzyme [Pseudomonadota bacterium]